MNNLILIMWGMVLAFVMCSLLGIKEGCQRRKGLIESHEPDSILSFKEVDLIAVFLDYFGRSKSMNTYIYLYSILYNRKNKEEKSYSEIIDDILINYPYYIDIDKYMKLKPKGFVYEIIFDLIKDDKNIINNLLGFFPTLPKDNYENKGIFKIEGGYTFTYVDCREDLVEYNN